MKTEDEIRAKLTWLRGQRDNFRHDVERLKRLDTEISRLSWVLGEGPDVILVPQPNVERSQLDQAGD